MGLDEIFGPAGILARRLAGYDFRAGQLAMAEAVARTLSLGGDPALNPGDRGSAAMLAVEAGTGIGKTLAYLVPAVLSGQKVVVSTGTLNLQEQVLNKEIPFIREHVDPGLDALCVKGRQNYLCLYRWQQMAADPQMAMFQDDGQGALLADWVGRTETGDRAELPWLADDSPLWPQLSCPTHQCLGTYCPQAQECFVNQLRKKAARARLLIVNHHLFFSDLALRRFGHAEVLPRYESVIFDEAHHLEGVATQYFGASVSRYQILDLAQDIEKAAGQHRAGKPAIKTLQLARVLADEAERFFALFPRERGRLPLANCLDQISDWSGELYGLLDRFAGLADHLDTMTTSGEVWDGMRHRCLELAAGCRRIMQERDAAHVYWAERREKNFVLAASPVAVAGDLQAALYPAVRGIVFTSATLTTAGTFSYFAERLGLPPATDTLALATPFDYAGRTLLYVPPPGFPAPQAPAFGPAARQLMQDIILLSRGRALLLFTSIVAMRAARDFLADCLPFPLLVQGEAPRQALLDVFQQDTHSVLLAVASFWEGVDVPGEALSCVIIDKLPFEVPSDPVMMARMDAIRDQGGNPFFDFQVPRAILTLRQGVGRLMRKASDRGVLAILDARLTSKGYGRLFLESLPPSPITRDLAAIATFFAEED